MDHAKEYAQTTNLTRHRRQSGVPGSLTLKMAWVVPVTVMTRSGQEPSLMCILAPLSSRMLWMISPPFPMIGPTSRPVVRQRSVRLTLGTSPGSSNSAAAAVSTLISAAARIRREPEVEVDWWEVWRLEEG